MDKTPAWLNWTLLQAVNLDTDLMRKINTVTGGLFGVDREITNPEPVKHKSMAEEMADLKRRGLNVRRG